MIDIQRLRPLETYLKIQNIIFSLQEAQGGRPSRHRRSWTATSQGVTLGNVQILNVVGEYDQRTWSRLRCWRWCESGYHMNTEMSSSIQAIQPCMALLFGRWDVLILRQFSTQAPLRRLITSMNNFFQVTTAYRSDPSNPTLEARFNQSKSSFSDDGELLHTSLTLSET